MVDYADLTGPDGTEENMGGLTQRLWYAPVRDFATIAAPSASTTLSDFVNITGDHVFKTGKCFKLMYCTMDAGEAKHELQGDRDGKSFKSGATVFYPGAELPLMGAMNQLKNDRMIALLEMPDGKIMQVGSEMFHAEFMPKFSTGKNSSGVRGWTIDIESMAPRPYAYTGVISVTPAP